MEKIQSKILDFPKDYERRYTNISVQIPEGYTVIKTKIKINNGVITFPVRKMYSNPNQ